MTPPLNGIKVLDLSWILAGPFATMVLADLGAEVIKVERPRQGDPARGIGPFLNGESTYFLSINRGKQSLTLDLSSPRGREIFLKLMEKVDVLVENFTPGTMKKLGLDYAALSLRYPQLIYAAISGFGQTGPYAGKPAVDIIVQGMGGIMSLTGEPGGPPMRPGASFGDIIAGLYAAIAILTALHEREQSGRGQMIDLSMLDCQVAVLENAFTRYLLTGEVPAAVGSRHPVYTPFQPFPTRDGHIVVAVISGAVDRWPLFCSIIGRPMLIADPRFATGWLRTQHHAELEPILNEAMKARTTAEWLEALSAADIPCGPVNRIDQAANDPQVRHREMVVEVGHPTLNRLRLVNSPLRFSRTPPQVERPAPALGEHTREVLSRYLGLGGEEVEALSREGLI